jgi:CheY-like chemotaxis protein
MAPAAVAGGSAESVSAAPTLPRRVLVVEDNPDVAESLAELVELLGHDVEIAHDGPAALTKARAHPPDFVLCDIGLPGFDGYSVAQRLRQETQLHGVYLIALSGYGHEHDKERAWRAGFDAYLVKPIKLKALESLLENPLEEKRADAEIDLA